jgi:hypothetical protein
MSIHLRTYQSNAKCVLDPSGSISDIPPVETETYTRNAIADNPVFVRRIPANHPHINFAI